MTGGSQSPLWRLVAKNAKTIVPLGGQGDGTPLYCVHSISGEVTSFNRMAEKVGTDRRIYGIQAPSDKMSAEFASSVPALASHYVEALTALQPEGPLMLGGWSVGGPIALEMAQQLKARGRTIPLLMVVDGILYNSGAELTLWNPLYYAKLAANLPRWIADNVMSGWGFSGIYARIKRELILNLSALKGRKSERGSTVDAFMDTSVLPPQQAAFARALFAATEDYVPKVYDGLVLIYAAKTHPLFHLHQVDVAWRKIASRSDTVYMAGTHLSMLREPQVSELSAHFCSYLDKLEQNLAPHAEGGTLLSKKPSIGYPLAQS
jgi:thioesterase domain-containing protein